MKIKIPSHNGRPVTRAQRESLVECARGMVGVPWQHMGRNRQGLDCAGLLILAIHEAMGVWVEVSDYSPWPDMATMRRICNEALLRKDFKQLSFGDVALMYAPGLGVVHLGWFTGETLIHADNSPSIKRVTEGRVDLSWILRGVYEVPQYEA